MRTSIRYGITVAAISATLLTGCSSDKASDTTTAVAEAVAEAPADIVAPIADGTPLKSGLSNPEALQDRSVGLTTTRGGGTSNDAQPGNTLPSTLINRKIIRNADITLEVPDVPKAVALLRSLVAASGGFLASEQANYGATDQVVLSFRIPVGEFDAALNRLGKIGSVLSTNVTSEEVTSQYRDIESRLRSKKVSADRLRELITRAVKASDILEIENELSNREAEIESMQGQLNVLSDQSSLSTIAVRVVGKGEGTVVEIRKEQEPSFTRAWHGSVDAVGNIAQAGAAASGAVLPFLPFIIALAALVFGLNRRSKRSRKTRNLTTSGSAVAVAEMQTAVQSAPIPSETESDES